MNRRPKSFLSLVLIGWAAFIAHSHGADNAAAADLVTKEITYEVDGEPFTGYLAYDGTVEGKRPGVLVVHEWWGHNEYARARAEQLARMGYTAFALDMYGAGKTTRHPDTAAVREAGGEPVALAALVDRTEGKARFLKAKELLESHETTDAGKIAAIGYCFGGGVVLNMARAGVDLDGVASFHGSLAPTVEIQPEAVTAKILVLHGGDDELVPTAQVEAFKREMDQAGVDYEFVSYPGAAHSFTNPDATEMGKKHDMPLAYDAEADEKSWARLTAFLDSLWPEH